MGVDKETFQFRSTDLTEVIDAMRTAANSTGATWLNFQPWVDETNMPKVSLWRHLFSNRGFGVPTATWIPGQVNGKNGPTPTEVGIQHGAGPKALNQLVEAEVTWPTDWRPMQDHVRRGIVFEAPTGGSPEETLDFVLPALRVLAQVPVDDRFVAGILSGS